jgi:hypothetical protein
MDEGESEREKSVRARGDRESLGKLALFLVLSYNIKKNMGLMLQYGSVVSVQCLCKEALQGKTS